MTSWIDVTGWTLLHFVWQGTLIGLAAAGALRLLRRHSPHARYVAACGALGLMLVVPALTATISSNQIAPPTIMPSASAVRAAFVPAGNAIDRVGVDPVTLTRAIEIDTILPLVVALWAGGVTILLLTLAGGCWRVRALHAAAWSEPASRWEAAGRRLASRLGVTRAVRIVDSLAVDAPTVIGWMRPVILLPVAALANLTTSQVEAILAHELAHIRRHDFAVNALQTVAETLLFYHPAVWWLSRRIRTEREHCCDDIAVAVSGNPYEYAAALTEIAALSLSKPRLAVAATGGSLLQRVRRVLGVQAESGERRASALIVFGLTLAIVVLAGGWRLYLVAQEPDVAAADRHGFGSANPCPTCPTGPPELNRLLTRVLGFELIPDPPQYPTDDPRSARAWYTRVTSSSGELSIVGFTARSLIRHTYGLVDEPIAGAPAWMDGETFDLTVPSEGAVVVNGLTDDAAIAAAMRQFLEQQLKLTWHFETRTFPAYALVRTGDSLGPNLRPTSGTCGFPCGVEDTPFGFKGRMVTMAQFAQDMKRPRSPLAIGRDVIDRTGLSGQYDFDLRIGFLPFAAIGTAHPTAGTLLYPFGVRRIADALPEQLGLKFVDATIDRQVLVIDHIERPAPLQ